MASSSWGPPWILAAAATLRGDPAEAVGWYRKAIAAGRRYLRWDLADPALASLRGDPRFQALVAGMRAEIEAMRRNAEEEGLWRPRHEPRIAGRL